MSKQENAKADNPNELITGHPFTFTGYYRSDNVEICGQCMKPESSHKFEETSELASTSANQPLCANCNKPAAYHENYTGAGENNCPKFSPVVANPPEPSLRDAIFHELNCFEVDASEINDGVTYIDSGEAETLTDSFMALFQTAIREKLIEVRNLGKNWEEPNEGTVYELNKMIEQLTHPQAGEGEGK